MARMTSPIDGETHLPLAPIRERGLVAAVGRSGGGDLASKAAVLVTTVVAARLLEPAAFAVYAGLLAVALLAASLWDAGISTLVTTAASRGAPISAVLAPVIKARFATLPIWLAAIAIGVLVFGSIGGVTLGSILAVSIGSIAAASGYPLQSILRGRLHFGRPVAASAAGRWLTALLAFGLLASGVQIDRLLALLMAQAAGEVATLAVSAVFVSRATREGANPTWDPREVSIRRALPFAANGVLTIAYNRLDIVLVATLTTTAQLAAYSPASRLQDALYLLPTALAAVALPYLSRSMATPGGVEASRTIIRRLWKAGLMLAIPAATLLIIGMPAVIAILLGSEYEGSVPAARILCLSMILAVVGGPILALLTAAGRGAATTKAFATAFAVSVLLNVTLDGSFGSIGAAISSVSRDIANVAVAVYCARDLIRPGLDAITPSSTAGESQRS